MKDGLNHYGIWHVDNLNYNSEEILENDKPDQGDAGEDYGFISSEARKYFEGRA